MTTSVIPPSTAKSWVALVGSALAVAVPLVLSVATYLPEPWPAVVGAVIALLTAAGVYKAPYKPADTVIAPTTSVDPPAPPPISDGYENPWKPREQ
jgi:hypothetical protein